MSLKNAIKENVANIAYEKKTPDENDHNGYNTTKLQLHKSCSVQNIIILGKNEFAFNGININA